MHANIVILIIYFYYVIASFLLILTTEFHISIKTIFYVYFLFFYSLKSVISHEIFHHFFITIANDQCLLCILRYNDLPISLHIMKIYFFSKLNLLLSDLVCA